jgi:hypothetical protein
VAEQAANLKLERSDACADKTIPGFPSLPTCYCCRMQEVDRFSKNNSE